MLDFAIAAEELTCVDVNVPTTLLATGLGLQPVIQYGSPEQKERFLRPFADDPEGDLLASYAFTDVAGGANFDSPDPAGGMQTIARRDGEEWVITGEAGQVLVHAVHVLDEELDDHGAVVGRAGGAGREQRDGAGAADRQGGVGGPELGEVLGVPGRPHSGGLLADLPPTTGSMPRYQG